MVTSKTPAKTSPKVSPKATAAVEIKKPAVTIETKKIMTDDCCKTASSCTPSGCCAPKSICCGGKILFAVLTVVNTILLSIILWNQNDAEIKKVGGRDNYKLVQDLQKTEGYKNRQKQQIQQAMQMFEKGQAQAPQTIDQQAAPTTPSTATTPSETPVQENQQAPAAE